MPGAQPGQVHALYLRVAFGGTPGFTLPLNISSTLGQQVPKIGFSNGYDHQLERFSNSFSVSDPSKTPTFESSKEADRACALTRRRIRKGNDHNLT